MVSCVIVGFGNIAERGHLPVLRDRDIDVAAVADVSEERREVAEGHGLESYGSFREALDGEDPDFVDIAVPPAYKLDVAEAASERGIDLLIEKPVCMPGEQGELAEVCRDVVAVPVHNYLRAPHFRRLKELAGDASRIGFEVRRTGFCEGNESWNPEWRVQGDVSGGGILMDHGYHAVYVSSHLAGRGVEDVELREMKMHRGVDFRTVFEMDLGGATAHVSLDWDSGERGVTVEADGYTLLDDRIENGATERMDHGLSDGSIHREWFGGVVDDLLEGLETREGRLDAAIEAMDVVESLYLQNQKA